VLLIESVKEDVTDPLYEITSSVGVPYLTLSIARTRYLAE
jgi:hypothetical protein